MISIELKSGRVRLSQLPPTGSFEDAQVAYPNLPDTIPMLLKGALDIFQAGCISDGNWDKLIDFVRFDLNTQANAVKGLKGVITAQFLNTDWFKYDCAQTRGLTGSYIKTGIIPSVIGSLNNFGIGASIKETRGTNAIVFGSIEPTANRSILLSETTGTLVRYGINTTNSVTTTANLGFADYANYSVDRSSSTFQRVIRDGVELANNTDASGGLATIELYMFARNNNNTAELENEGRARGYWVYNPVGFNIAAFNTRWNALSAAIDSLIPFIPVVFSIGQSNEVGRGEISRLAEPLLNPAGYIDSPVGLKLFYKSTHDMVDNGKWVKYRGGVNSVEPANESVLNNFGAEISLGTRLYNRLKVPIYYIKAGNGGTALQSNAQPDWAPASVNEEFNISTQRFFTPAINKIVTEYPGKEIRIIILWQQGEQDAQVTAWKNAYSTNFPAFVSALRSYDSRLSNVPFIATKIYYNIGVDEDAINAVFQSFTGSNFHLLDIAPLCTWPRKVDLPTSIKTTFPPTGSDDIHDSEEFQIKKGEKADDLLLQIGYM